MTNQISNRGWLDDMGCGSNMAPTLFKLLLEKIMSKIKYKVVLPAVDIPDSWTNYHRDVIIQTEIPAGNSRNVLFSDKVDENEFEFEFEATESREDIIVRVDLNNNKPAERFHDTAGFDTKICNSFSVINMSGKPEPVVEPDPEPVVEPEPEVDDDEDSDNDDNKRSWKSFI